MKFFRSKRELAVSAMESDFDDTKADRLYDDNYTQDEVSPSFALFLPISLVQLYEYDTSICICIRKNSYLF
jgi:hypothetical protein